jgi:hypothetical protein
MKHLLHLLVLALAGSSYYQCPHDRDNRVHEVFRSGGSVDHVIGWYTQRRKGDPYVITCVINYGSETVVSTEQLSQITVESCPRW